MNVVSTTSKFKFSSPCRICMGWRVQGRHWISMWEDFMPTGDYPTEGYWEECIPSDNLEYLEYRNHLNEKAMENR